MLARIALVLLPALVIAGCAGDDELRFSADEFVSEANTRGAALELGTQLISDREGTEIHELTLARADETEGHSGGSLTVTTDSESGLTEFERCEAAATLLCFRANNVVLSFEDELAPDTQTELEKALRTMARDAGE